MKYSRILAAAALLMCAPSGANAQATAEAMFEPGTITLSATLGGVAFTDFRRTEARASSAIPGEEGMERRLSAQTSLAFGAGAGVWIGRSWGLRVEGSYAPTRFDIDIVSEDGSAGTQQMEGAGLDVWTTEAHLIFRLPFGIDRLVPYGLVGGGAAFYDVRGDDEAIPFEARDSFARGSRTRFAGVFGLGAVLPLERYGLLLRFELTDLMTRTPVASGAMGTFEAEDGNQHVAESDRSDGMTSHVRFNIGLTLPIR